MPLVLTTLRAKRIDLLKLGEIVVQPAAWQAAKAYAASEDAYREAAREFARVAGLDPAEVDEEWAVWIEGALRPPIDRERTAFDRLNLGQREVLWRMPGEGPITCSLLLKELKCVDAKERARYRNVADRLAAAEVWMVGRYVASRSGRDKREYELTEAGANGVAASLVRKVSGFWAGGRE